MQTVRTFIVDDNPTIRENLAGTLREVAHVDLVGEAASEAQGLNWLARNRFQWDLTIVDLFLEEGSGLRLLEACRDRLPAQKIVVLSNHATARVRQKCVELGADAVFDKATEIDDLIDFCLRRRQALLSAH